MLSHFLIPPYIFIPPNLKYQIFVPRELYLFTNCNILPIQTCWHKGLSSTASPLNAFPKTQIFRIFMTDIFALDTILNRLVLQEIYRTGKRKGQG